MIRLRNSTMKVAPNNLTLRSLAVVCFAALVVVAGIAAPAVGQQGYGSYYGQKVTSGMGGLPPTPNKFLYDKYFYNRPTVNPYMSLDMGDTDTGTAYSSYVRPEQQRRQQQRYNQAMYIDARKKAGNVGYTQYPGAMGGGTAIMKPAMKQPQSKMGTYHNHWYGGWGK